MRISDWSSDVCSSDLRQIEGRGSPINLLRRGCAKRQAKSQQRNGYDGRAASAGKPHHHAQNQSSGTNRSEERRVGKEVVSTDRSRWSPTRQKQNKQRKD